MLKGLLLFCETQEVMNESLKYRLYKELEHLTKYGCRAKIMAQPFVLKPVLCLGAVHYYASCQFEY